MIDPIASHARRLERVLEERDHRVTLTMPEPLPGELGPILMHFDVVIVNMTLNRPEDWDLLRRLCQWKPMEYLRLGILAVCSVYQGPQPKLRAERLGCRWVYDG